MSPVDVLWGKTHRDRLINDADPEQQWIVEGDGHLTPDVTGVVGIGNSTAQPQHIALGNIDGLRGLIVSFSPANGDITWVIGTDAEGMAQDPPETTRAVGIAGAAILFNSESGGYLFRMPDGIDPEAVEGHRVVWGATTLIGGVLYAHLTVGALEPVAQEETFFDATDYNFIVTLETLALLTNTVVNTYTDITSFQWSLTYANDGDRAADMVVQPQVHRGASWIDVGPTITMRLTQDEQAMFGSTDIPAPHLIAGDQVRLWCLSTTWAHVSRPDPWIRGSIDASEIHLVQGGVV